MTEIETYAQIVGPEVASDSVWELLQLYDDGTLGRIGEPGKPDEIVRVLHAQFREDIEDDLEDLGDDYWEDAPEWTQSIHDPALRAFAVYAEQGILAKRVSLAECTYVREPLRGREDAFVAAWEAQPPLHDVAYCIVRCNTQ